MNPEEALRHMIRAILNNTEDIKEKDYDQRGFVLEVLREKARWYLDCLEERLGEEDTTSD